MKASSKFAGFTAGLAVVFALAFGAGSAFGPGATPTTHTDTTPTLDTTDPAPAGHGH
ncbi:hypothetical protein [uncultured Gordonia sp.]|uniref:hypothetical protein n=1 Tax=uncultured Gordonia sp. TaxID=198437 RepID=UPI00260AC389|nr:hypothetical protein [uncultured Gordonia sp.]